MVVPSRVTTRDLVRSLERKTGRSREELERLVDMLCLSVREYLEQGSEVALGDLFALAVHGGPELREDESGGFSAFAATEKSLTATPVGQRMSISSARMPSSGKVPPPPAKVSIVLVQKSTRRMRALRRSAI